MVELQLVTLKVVGSSPSSVAKVLIEAVIDKKHFKYKITVRWQAKGSGFDSRSAATGESIPQAGASG